FQTAYLKAHYPAEYMAAVLNNSANIEKTTQLMEECKRMGINVLGPDVNESYKNFFVNKNGDIRFGLFGIKGLGEATIDSIIEEREKDGPYTSIFDLVKRISSKATNKKSLEALACSGAFDCFEGTHRAQYLAEDASGTGIDKIIKFANAYKQNAESNMLNLFGDNQEAQIPEPKLPVCEPWDKLYALNIERDYVGMFLSGHPLDKFKNEINLLTTCSLDKLDSKINEVALKTQIKVAGIVYKAEHLVNKNGKPYGRMTIDDFNGSYNFMVTGNEYEKFTAFITKDLSLFITG